MIWTHNIPVELKLRRQWLLWRKEFRGGNPTKVPYQTTGEPAKTTDPATWCDYLSAVAVLRRGLYSGVGYAFSVDDPFVGIDLDNCISEGGVTPEAKRIVDALGSYAEISPSHKGVKVWARAKLETAGSGRRRSNAMGMSAVEMYQHSRYFAVTGWRLQSAPKTIEPAQGVVNHLWRRLFGENRTGAIAKPAQVANRTTCGNKLKRCLAYLAKCPDAVSGQGGHDRTYRVACECWRFGLTEAEVWHAMEVYNAQKSKPPWSERELRHKIDSSKRTVLGEGAFGRRLMEKVG